MRQVIWAKLMRRATPSAGVRELEAPQIKVWGSYINRRSGEAPAGSKGKAPGQGVRGGFLPEATFLAFGRSPKVTILPTLKNWNAKKSDTVCVVFFPKNDVYRPQYVTDYCTVTKSNRIVHFGETFHMFIYFISVSYTHLTLPTNREV